MGSRKNASSPPSVNADETWEDAPSSLAQRHLPADRNEKAMLGVFIDIQFYAPYLHNQFKASMKKKQFMTSKWKLRL
jgi:hypothetical protein